MFWWRREADDQREAAPGPAETSGDDLAPVRIFTADSILDGWVQLLGQRLSDVVNVEDLLSVSRVPVAPTQADWQVVEREHMLLVVPPPVPADRRLRRHRVRRPILALSGHYVVRGMVHMIAGIALDAFLARSGQHFLPLTETRVTSTQRRELDEQHAALLVNVRSTAQPLQLEVVE